MKIRILSDLHLELRDLEYLDLSEPADICVLAGDIFNYKEVARKKQFPKLLDQIIAEHTSVLMVEGNHELYHGSFEDRNIPDSIIFLDKGIIEIEGIKFAGCTLWSNITKSTKELRGGLNDFYTIKEFKDKWQAYQELHVAHKAFLEMAKADVVITHHAPFVASTAPMFAGSPYNIFFSSNIDLGRFSKQPKLWIHGHMHNCNDYMQNHTRVVSNPRGYETYARGRENVHFNSNCIVEI